MDAVLGWIEQVIEMKRFVEQAKGRGVSSDGLPGTSLAALYRRWTILCCLHLSAYRIDKLDFGRASTLGMGFEQTPDGERKGVVARVVHNRIFTKDV